MKRLDRIYLALLCMLVAGWLILHGGALGASLSLNDPVMLLGAVALYGLSHLLRMLRLVLLTLDQRDKAFAISAAHALTAFPSSFLPFKIGEALRLAALFRVFGKRRKAAAVWLSERFGDEDTFVDHVTRVIAEPVIRQMDAEGTPFIGLLYALFGLLALFAVAKTFVYLNRHLVLHSYSRHGLWLLKLSHALRQLELDIYRSVEGRLTGLLLLSLIIWLLEIAALSLFINLFAQHGDFASLFANGLLASLPGRSTAFGQFQLLALAVLTLLFLFALGLAARIKSMRS